MTTDRYAPGAAVALEPHRGGLTSSYAEVVEYVSPSLVRVRTTADSGGRKRGKTYTVPLGRVAPRDRGRHRKPAQKPWKNSWWGR